jgi:outer membrane receptor for ferrienterochelin and colicins
MNKRKLTQLGFLGAALALHSSLAIAQDETVPAPAPAPAPAPEADSSGLGDLEALLGESVVTTASRSAERASTAPATVFTVTSSEMRTYGIRTVDEALDYLGLGVYTASARDYTSPSDVGAQGVLIRDRGRHILVMLDGHVMNSQSTGAVTIHEALGVPLEAINHLEVMLGAGSVMYGSNAMLAVINVVTKLPRDMKGLRAVAEFGSSMPTNDGKLRGPGHGNELGQRYRVGINGGFSLGDKIDLTIAAEWLQEFSSTYKIAPTTVPTVGVSFLPGQGTWGGAASHTLVAPSIVVGGRIGVFRILAQANSYRREMPLIGVFDQKGSEETQAALRLDIKNNWDLNDRISLGSRLYADQHRFSETSSYGEDYWCIDGQANGCQYRGSSRARWAGLEEQLNIDWHLDGKLTSTIGFDVRARDTLSYPADYRDLVTGQLSSVVPRPMSSRKGVLGALFAQQVWKPTEWLALNAGARLDSDTDFGSRVSPRLAATVEPGKGAAVRASYAEAFRGPTPYELDEFDPTYRLTPKSLAPEIARAAELEWQQRLAWVTFSLRGFASYYQNFIDARLPTQAEFDAALPRLSSTASLDLSNVNDNLATIRAYGGSSSVTLRSAQGLALGGTFNYAHSRRDGQKLTVMPVWFGNLRASYQPTQEGMAYALAARYAGSRRVAADLDVTDLFVSQQLDLRGTVTGPLLMKGLRFRASVGYAVNPWNPHAITIPDEMVGETRARFSPVSNRLFGFIGLEYAISP